MAFPGYGLSNNTIIKDKKSGKRYLLVKGLAGALVGHVELKPGLPKFILDEREVIKKAEKIRKEEEAKQQKLQEEYAKEYKKAKDKLDKKFQKEMAPGILEKAKRAVFGGPKGIIIDNGELLGSIDYADAEDKVRKGESDIEAQMKAAEEAKKAEIIMKQKLKEAKKR